ncbi:PAAR domain-containing protein [Thaumasiovibrio subtropicus]|uniref:PAAR domain-containing protein n=1 Tax=Thaumasiovibrio subtropicus TaxID=1891207 RepID=UPI000B354846|nr:PAAR domain-containing protein [Thaumasiovibrio subtropicus]
MGKPAANVGSGHSCPAKTGKIPHVGGPVATGSGNVFVEGKPASKVGDMCVCCGPPDSIAAGSGSVFINGQPAARMGDGTAHGGSVISGAATVTIGDAGIAFSPQTVNVEKVVVSLQRSGDSCAESASPAVETQSNSVAPIEDEPIKVPSVKLIDQHGNPYAGYQYVINKGGNELKREVPSDGIITLEEYENDSEVSIEFWQADNEYTVFSRKVKLKSLEDQSSGKGVQQRLRNLSVLTSKVDGNIAEVTKRNISYIQYVNGEKVDGAVSKNLLILIRNTKLESK